MVDVTTPLPGGTAVGELINNRFHGWNLLKDTSGADAMGVVGASPDGNTLLGRLKAIFTALIDSSPASSGGAVIKSDSTALAMRSLYVGGAGDVTVTLGGSSVTFTAVPAGTWLPIKATQVKATGTTATNMVWLA